LIQLQVKSGAEVASNDPVEEFLAERLLAAGQEFADRLKREPERQAGRPQSHRIHDLVGPAFAKQSVDRRAQQRQQRNNP
jgi:hypothetical protein